MNYTQTLDFLFTQLTSFQHVGAAAYKPGLERIEEFCHALGNPQNDYHTIHIAGTNGKGSTSHMIASVLQHSGYRVGLFTSPHLKDFRERMRVDGEMISEQSVVDFVAQHFELIKYLGLSFFEITAAMAFDHFSKQGVEVAVIETGLGGRLDATNIITPLVSVITNIGHDHTDLLGGTLPAIAGEKAGIIKRGVPVVVGESDAECDDVFVAKAAQEGVSLSFAQQCFTLLDRTKADALQHFKLRRERDGELFDVSLDLLGEYQFNNIITASAVLDVLHRLSPLTIPRQGYLEGLMSAAATTRLVGRWQVLSHDPLVVCDTGHNAHGLKYVTAQLEELKQKHDKVVCVLGFAREKNLDEVLPLLLKSAWYIFTQASSPRALPAEELARQAAVAGLQGEVVQSVAAALEYAKSMVGSEGAIFVGGSNFVVAEIL